MSDGTHSTAEPPTKPSYRRWCAFQVGLDLILVVASPLVMLPFGLLGQVTTVIVPRSHSERSAPPTILYERRLDYRPMAIAELVRNHPLLRLGSRDDQRRLGRMGTRDRFLVRALSGSMVLLILPAGGRVPPVPSWTKVKTLLGFGFRYQAVGLLQMLRDQGVNIAVAAFGGVAVLGLWSVAWRIIQIPYSLFVALWRVSFPEWPGRSPRRKTSEARSSA